MKLSVLASSALLVFVTSALPAAAQSACGGDFAGWLEGVRQEAAQQGISASTVDGALLGAKIDQRVLSADQAQGVFSQDFMTFAGRMISGNRMQQGQSNMSQYADTFRRAEAEYGVPAAVITAFWGLETDFGAVQGDFNTFNALVTLAHDCRRPDLFRPQLISFLKLAETGDADARATTGAWAGEIGQVQMLPEDIIKHGVDGDGDGHVDLKKSAADAIMTAAKLIQSMGWQPGQPWLQEVRVPAELPWEQAGLFARIPVSQWQQWGVAAANGSLPDDGLPASLLLPMGRNGPAFLAYPNFDVYLEWNQSLTYTTTAAYFATRLAGAERVNAGSPQPGLSADQMKALQQRLADKGYNVGKIDGILGAGTRAAIRAEQQRLGLPADAWPTAELLQNL